VQRNVTALHRVLLATLPPAQVQDVFSRIFALLNRKIPQHFEEVSLWVSEWGGGNPGYQIVYRMGPIMHNFSHTLFRTTFVLHFYCIFIAFLLHLSHLQVLPNTQAGRQRILDEITHLVTAFSRLKQIDSSALTEALEDTFRRKFAEGREQAGSR
jgi:hypothetical protein